jgi:hypothetical protein
MHASGLGQGYTWAEPAERLGAGELIIVEFSLHLHFSSKATGTPMYSCSFRSLSALAMYVEIFTPRAESASSVEFETQLI